MADPAKPKSRSGCLTKLVFLILLIGAVGLGCALFLIAQPQDLSNIGGYAPPAKAPAKEDMKTVLKNAVDRGYALNLTEERLNNWLGQSVSAKQGGLLGQQVTFERVWVRLEDGFAEIIMERKLFGRPFTLSLFLKIEQLEGPNGVRTELKLDGGPYHKDFPHPPRGGRFGKLEVPQGFLILILPAYRNLAALFPEEKRLGLEEMARIKIEKGHLILDPRAPAPGDPLMPQTF